MSADLNHLGVITALLPEAKHFTTNPVVKTPISLSDKVTLYVSGMGSENTIQAARELISHGADGLISLGTAGALSPALRPGDLIVPESVISHGDKQHALESDWRRDSLGKLSGFNRKIHQGKLLQADQIVMHPSEKAHIHHQTGAIAVDMESLSVINVAHDAKIPVLVVRVIVDPVTMVIPAFVLETCSDFGEANLASLLGSLIIAPARIASLVRLGRSFREAGKSLNWLGKHLHLLVGYAGD